MKVEVAIDILLVNLSEETARFRELHITPLESHIHARQCRQRLGTRECNIEETSLLLNALNGFECALRREEILLATHHIYIFVLQAFGRVYGHQRNAVVLLVFSLIVHIG